MKLISTKPFILKMLGLIGIFFWTSSIALQASQSRYVVSSVEELRNALEAAKSHATGASIVLRDGIYEISGAPIKITQDFIKISSLSADKNKVVFTGQGAQKGVGTLLDVSADYFSISDVTLQNARWHLIQIRAEADADYFHMKNCKLLDSGQQLLKISHKKDGPFSDFGIIENSHFEYTSGFGLSYYIGGIDAHKSVDWLVQNNTFRNISSPKEKVAEHAIHFWNDSKRTRVVGNKIIDSDRGIGFGMMDRPKQHRGGVISGNVIVHNKPDNPFADVGIILESSPGTKVQGNIVFLNTDYPNAIEYRFKRTQNVIIENNQSNKAISARNGGQAILRNNHTSSFTTEMIDNVKYLIKKPNQ